MKAGKKTGVETGMKAIRSLVIMTVILLAGLAASPEKVYAASGISISDSAISLGVGESRTITLTYTIESDEAIEYSVDSTDVIVTEGAEPAGLENQNWELTLEGKKVNPSITLTAKVTKGGSIIDTATCNIAVTGSRSISLDKTSIVLSKEKTNESVSATTNYSGGDLTWTFDKEYVTVNGDSTGSTTIAPGTPVTITAVKKNLGTTITVKDAADLTVAQKNITVSINELKPVTNLSLDKTTLTLKSGDASSSLTLTTTPADTDSDISWNSSNTGVATVAGTSAGATINKVGVGKTTISVSSGAASAICEVNVTDVTALDITPSTFDTLYSGQSITLNGVIKTGTQTSPVDYSWSVTGSGITPTSGTGASVNFTAANAGPGDVSATIKVTDSISGVSASKTITVKPAKSVTGITISPATVKVTKGFTVNVSSVIAPTDASTIGKLKWDTSDHSYATVSAATPTSAKVTGVKPKTDDGLTVFEFISKADNSSAEDVTKSAKLYVYDTPSISYGDNKLSITLPASIYTGNSNDIDNVTKGVLKVFYDGNCLWTSDKSSSYKSGATISASDIQSIIKKSEIYDKIKSVDKDTTTLQFRIYGANDSAVNESAYGECDVPVYRLTVSGTGIKTVKEYAVKGVEVKLTATPESNYTFSKWSDGTTTNPRTVTVSEAKNYGAEATSKATNANAANGANGAANGAGAGNSKLDKVPKTGEGRDVFIMWMILIVCSVAAGALLIIQNNQKKAFMNSENNTDKKN